ncbi:MAG: phage tail tape measure protein [Halanaerobiales bacterium]|nr:phage tail tape measure protein [Halanaerobiales bacterium]
MGSSIKNLKRTVLGTQREFQAYGNQMQKLNQTQILSSQGMTRYNQLMGNYQKNLVRLATQVPKNVNQQNSWSASVTRTSNALRPYVKNFDQLTPVYKKINQQAFQAGTNQRLYNQSMSQGTGITQRAGKATTTLKQKFGGLLENLRKGHGAWYDWGRVFNHFLPIVFVGVYAFKALTDKIDILVKAFADFESQLITVERTTGMAHSQVMNLRETIFELARVTPIATSGLMEVAITAGRLGIRGSANIMGFTDTVTKMASATVLTADQAANALARISKAMELPIENVENLGAMIDELANTAAADAEQITTALKRAAGGAKVLDVPVAMLGAMVTTLVESGEEAARTGTRLGRIFTYASVKIATMARQMGISTQEMRRQMETNVTQVFLDYLKMLDNTTSKVEKLRMAHEVFGMIGVKSISKLAENYDLLIGHLKDAQAQIIFGTTLEREYARTLGTTAAQMQMLTNQIDELGIRIGEKLTPVTLAFMNIHKSFLDTLIGPELPQFTSMVVGVSSSLKLAMGQEEETIRIGKKMSKIYSERNLNLDEYKHLISEINRLHDRGAISTEKYEETMTGLGETTIELAIISALESSAHAKGLIYLLRLMDAEELRLKIGIEGADVASKGAISQLYLNDVLNKGWNSLIMIARQNKRVEKGRISLVRTMIKEGIAGKELEKTYEGLVDSILEQKRIVKELQEAYINFNQIEEWTATLLGEETDAFYKAAIAQGKALEGWSNMNEQYEETIDLMDTLKGDIPELIDILGEKPTGLMKSMTDAITKELPDAFGDFVKIGDTIVPIKKTIESIRKEAEELGRVKGVGDPLNMEKMIELYGEWQKETDEYKKSIREQTLGEGELKLKKQELLNSEVKFIKYLTSHFSDYDEAINYLDELGLANTELGKAVIDTMKRIGRMLPEAMSKPVEDALKLYIEWQKVSKEYAILSRILTGDDVKAKEELAEVRNRLFENEKAYTSYLTSHFSDYATVIEFLHKSGLASDEYGKSIISLLTLKEEELGLWKETPKAMAAAFDYFDAAIHYGTRLEAIYAAQVIAQKKLEKWDMTGKIKEIKDNIDLMVKNNELLENEGEYLKERAELYKKGELSLEEFNNALLHSVSYSYYAMQQGLDLDESNQKVEDGYKSLNSQIFEMASQMAKGGLITGAVADDILLLTGSQLEFGRLLDKDVDALDTFLDHLMLVGAEMKDWDKFIHAVNASLQGTGIEIFKVDAAGTRLKEGDDMREFFLGIGKESENAAIVSQENITSIISTWQKLPQASKDVLKGIGLEYLTGAPAHITAAFTGTTEDKLSSMTLSTGSSADTLNKIYENGILMRDVEGAQWGGYVKETGIYRLHRGEIVTPASKVEKGSGSPIHISFPNMIIKEELDVNKIRSKIADVIDSELTNRLGR